MGAPFRVLPGRSVATLVSLALVAAIAAPPAGTAPRPRGITAIRPGPLRQTEDERALAPEDTPTPGAHAVFLLVERCRDDRAQTEMVERVHYRAKVFHDDGLALARIRVPLGTRGSRLADFWARAILPDGTVKELSRDDLERQSRRIGGKSEPRVFLRGKIPGVVPGAVLDVGWEVHHGRGLLYSLEYWGLCGNGWPILRASYEWIPGGWGEFAWFVHARRELDVKAFPAGRNGVRIEARDLPAAVLEDHRPPFPLGEDLVAFYYIFGKAVTNEHDFWTRWARDVARQANVFLRRGRRDLEEKVAEVLRAGGLDGSAPDEARARALYEWVRTSFGNDDAENPDADDSPVTHDTRPRGRNAWSAAAVLARGRGSARETDYLAWALLRAAGLRAHLVAATDITTNAWVPRWMNQNVLTATLVAVDLPGEDGSLRRVFLDPSAGGPWGDLPYVHTTQVAPLVRDDGYEEVRIPPTSPDRNVRTMEVRLAPDPAAGKLRASWTVHLQGGLARNWREVLRRSGPEDVPAWICADEDEQEKVDARIVPPVAPGEGLAVACELVHPLETGEDGSVEVSLGKPWWSPIPVFDEEIRRFPVFLPLLLTERAIVAIEPPPGMVPAGLPEPAEASSPWGRYSISFAERDGTIYVETTWRLERPLVPVEEFPRFREWMQAVHAHDGTRIRFVPATDGTVPGNQGGKEEGRGR